MICVQCDVFSKSIFARTHYNDLKHLIHVSFSIENVRNEQKKRVISTEVTHIFENTS